MEPSVVTAAQSGDRDALEQVCRGLYAPMYHAAFGVLTNHADAEDAVQQGLINVVRNLSTFDGRSALTTWAHRIALNAALDLRRSKAARPTTQLDLHPDDVSSNDSADALAAQQLILAALRQLPDEHAEVIVLRELLGHEYSEIATMLDVPVGTVRSRLSRARQGLQETLRDLLNDDDTPRDGTLPTQPTSNQR